LTVVDVNSGDAGNFLFNHVAWDTDVFAGIRAYEAVIKLL